MLVLTRSCDEEIRIGDDVIIRVLDVKGDRVRIGIQAPANIPVHRQEVYQEIERANQQARQVHATGLEGARRMTGATEKQQKLKSLSGSAAAANKQPRR